MLIVKRLNVALVLGLSARCKFYRSTGFTCQATDTVTKPSARVQAFVSRIEHEILRGTSAEIKRYISCNYARSLVKNKQSWVDRSTRWGSWGMNDA